MSTAAPAPTMSVFFVHGEHLGPTKQIGSTLRDALRELLAGPTQAELQRGMRTYIPAGAAVHSVAVADGLATVDLSARFAGAPIHGIRSRASRSSCERLPVERAPRHGCVRQSFAVARMTYEFADIGMPVRVLGAL